ncbi:hypothetical protein RI367_007740 [Sorochytrium milnesiophthora]
MADSSAVVPICAVILLVTALLLVGVAAVLWKRHLKFIKQGSPRSLVLLFGLVFTAGDWINNAVMVATASQNPPLSYYIGHLMIYPAPVVMYLACVYRLVILILNRQTRRRLLWASWIISILSRINSFYWFYVSQVAVASDPTLVGAPTPIWGTAPDIYFTIAPVVMSVATLRLMYGSAKALQGSGGSTTPGTATSKTGGEGGASASGAGNNNSIYFPLSATFKRLTAAYIGMWILYWLYLAAFALMDKRISGIMVTLLVALGLLLECSFEFLLRHVRNQQASKQQKHSASQGTASPLKTQASRPVDDMTKTSASPAASTQAPSTVSRS